jgi:organic hydroperoxide reductase OsmC/OhrA
MSDGQTHHINVQLVRKYQFTAQFPDVTGAPSLPFDELPPVGDGRGPNAAMVLGAAIGNCLSATLADCLRRAHVEVDALTATVLTRVARNQGGRFRVASIDVTLTPTVSPSQRGGFTRCQEIFQNYCTATESVRQGIPVTVSFTQLAPDAGDVGHRAPINDDAR